MAVSKTTVTGPVYLPNCSKPESAKIIFELSSWDQEMGEAVFVSGPYVATLDVNGDFSVDLWSSAVGENQVVYNVFAVYILASGSYKREFLGSMGLSGPGPLKMADIGFITEWAPNSFDVLAQTAANQLAAETAETAAQVAQAASEAALDEFTDLYLGRFAVAPTLDNDGDPLDEGAVYYDTVDTEWKNYSGTIWQSGAGNVFQVPNNLSEVLDPAAARTNLGMPAASVAAETVVPIAKGGTGAITALAGFDALKQSSTDIYSGVVMKSNSAKNIAGIDDAVFTSVADTKEMIDTHGEKKPTIYRSVSGLPYVASGDNFSWAHGLGVLPDFFTLTAKCIVAANGFSVGEIIDITDGGNTSASNVDRVTMIDTTNIQLKLGGHLAFVRQGTDTTFAYLSTGSSWEVYLTCGVYN